MFVFNKNADQKMNTIKTLKITRNAAFLAAAVTGVSVIWPSVYYRAVDFLPQWAAITVTVLTVIGVLFVVDFGNRQYMPYSMNLIIHGTWKRDIKVKQFTVLLALLSLGLTAITLRLSWEARNDVMELAMPEPETVDEAKVKMQLDKATQTKLADIDKDIAKYEKLLRADSAAVAAKYPESWQRVQSGNDPYGYHYSRVIAPALAKSTRSHMRRLESLQHQKEEIRAEEQAMASQAIAAASARNVDVLTSYEAKFNRNRHFYGWFGIISIVAAILSSYLLELRNEEADPAVTHRTSTQSVGGVFPVPTGPLRASGPSTRPKRSPGLSTAPVSRKPSSPTPDLEPVRNPMGPDRQFEFLSGKVSDHDRRLEKLEHTGMSPSLATGDKSDKKPGDTGDTASSMSRRPATRRQPSRPATAKRRKTGDKKSSDRSRELKRLKDKGRRQYERGQTDEWAATRKELEARGCTFEPFTNDEGEKRIKIKGGK